MRKILKLGVFALLGMALAFSASSCSDDDPDYSNVTPPTVAQVHNISGSIAGRDGKGISGATVKTSAFDLITSLGSSLGVNIGT